ncbi:MAG: methylated-DNA--[protein]-cysteine S-methyltransferase, partial [Bdellovibrionales bacterium]|nr:methylated-DNA--[protein]-cysteine S-methyltransferase [Bdellovibrionales bacterium]
RIASLCAATRIRHAHREGSESACGKGGGSSNALSPQKEAGTYYLDGSVVFDSVYFLSPVGWLRIFADGGVIVRVSWVRRGIPGDASSPLLRQALKELGEYFSGERRQFDVPVRALGTEFSEKVWHRLAAIPYGETLSYSALATDVGCPGGARAVGSACGRNPVPIIIPCHRVLPRSGQLGGFAWGQNAKRVLLQLENQTW